MIHDPRYEDTPEPEELEDLSPSDPDDPLFLPERDATPDENSYAQHGIPPNGLSSYPLYPPIPAPSSTPNTLPPLPALYRTQASTGTSRSRPRPQNDQSMAEPWHGAGPSSHHLQGGGEGSGSGLAMHRGSVPMETHAMTRSSSSRGERRRRVGSTPTVNQNSEASRIASDLERVAAATSRLTVASPSWTRWNGFDSPASGSASSSGVGTPTGAITPRERDRDARRTLANLHQHLRPEQLMTPTHAPPPLRTTSGGSSASGSSNRADAGSSRSLPVAEPALGGNTSDSSAASASKEGGEGGDEEIDTHDRRSRNRDSDATVKALRTSSSVRRGSVATVEEGGRSASPATRHKKGLRGALSSAEQYASTFLFGGKGKARDQSPGGSRPK